MMCNIPFLEVYVWISISLVWPYGECLKRILAFFWNFCFWYLEGTSSVSLPHSILKQSLKLFFKGLSILGANGWLSR